MSESIETVGKPQKLFHNYISYAGAALVIACLASIFLLLLIEMTGRRSTPYIGIFAWVILPSIMVLGLVVFFAGMALERKRRRSTSPSILTAYPVIDLNDPGRRKVFLVFLALVFVFVSVSAFGSFQAYEATESVAFCGQTCHTVMKPEFVAFQNSPHARLHCVDCHVGEGAEWYIRSKLNGVHQLYAVTFNTYEKPIKTPVANMRPANDTCAKCHWPERFIGNKLKVFDRYAYDQNNTLREMKLLINVGGGSAENGLGSGIHWHMNISNEITFVAADERRQSIPWVQAKDANGNVTTYEVANSPLTASQISSAPKRRMDCIDCHNRPAHIYNPPDTALDSAFAAKRLDASLPYLKREAVAALSATYTTNDDAVKKIASSLESFYRNNYASVYSEKRSSVDAAIKEVQRIYQVNFFPEMKTDWQAHPNNIGHFQSAGCFRCHDGEHRSNTGKVIRNDCSLCHTTIFDSAAAPEKNSRTGAFKHPVQLGALADRKCESCHQPNKPFKHPIDLGDISMFQCVECHPRK